MKFSKTYFKFPFSISFYQCHCFLFLNPIPASFKLHRHNCLPAKRKKCQALSQTKLQWEESQNKIFFFRPYCGSGTIADIFLHVFSFKIQLKRCTFFQIVASLYYTIDAWTTQGLGAPTPAVKNPCVTVDSLQKLLFLRIHGRLISETPIDPEICGCSSLMKTVGQCIQLTLCICRLPTMLKTMQAFIEKSLHTSGPMQFKFVLFKGQLYLKQNYISFIIVTWLFSWFNYHIQFGAIELYFQRNKIYETWKGTQMDLYGL